MAPLYGFHRTSNPTMRAIWTAVLSESMRPFQARCRNFALITLADVMSYGLEVVTHNRQGHRRAENMAVLGGLD